VRQRKRKNEEGRRKKEEGRRKKSETLGVVPRLYLQEENIPCSESGITLFGVGSAGR
jgi:hypothetical protein